MENCCNERIKKHFDLTEEKNEKRQSNLKIEIVS